jgi:uncharacterized protein (DUF983 family)
MSLPNIIYSTTSNKCPKCNKGKVFETNNPYSTDAFKMYEQCSECNLKYEMEPGFFYGAMYVSYAFMSGIFIVWFFINYLWLNLGPWQLIAYVVGSMLVFFPVVYRWARTLWLNFFIRYDRNYATPEVKNN